MHVGFIFKEVVKVFSHVKKSNFSSTFAFCLKYTVLWENPGGFTIRFGNYINLHLCFLFLRDNSLHKNSVHKNSLHEC